MYWKVWVSVCSSLEEKCSFHYFCVGTDMHKCAHTHTHFSQQHVNSPLVNSTFLHTCAHAPYSKHWLFLLLPSSSDWCPRGRRERGGIRRQLVPAAVLWQRWRTVQGVGQTDAAGGQTAACWTAGRPPRRHHLHPQQGGCECVWGCEGGVSQ